MKRLPFLLVGVCLCFLLIPASALATPSFDQAVDRLLAEGYPQGIENYLSSLGTCPLGMRSAGDSADNAGARFIASELRALGLRNVRLEPVPIDAWEFHSASVTIGDTVLPASSWNGMQATPRDGLMAPVVYVHGGTAEDFEKAGDVHGKLVLVDVMFDWWYPYYPWSEATMRGAIGCITTWTAADPAYWGAPDALGSFAAEYDLTKAPAVWVSPNSGAWLREQLAAGPVTATMKLDATLKSAEQGGTGYNVVGELPGAARNGQMVLITAHHDCYWRGGLDNTSGVAQALTIAKAAKLSGFKPQRTWVFMLTTGEEYGRTEAYYDWLVGAYWAIAKAHPDWPGRVAGNLNLEAQGNGPIEILAAKELQSPAAATLGANRALAPYGWDKLEGPNSWTDQWPINAAGVPSITYSSDMKNYTETIYHTQFDTPDLVEWPYFGQMGKLAFRLAKQLDGEGLLPYDLSARADDLDASVNDATLLGAGAEAATVSRLSNDVAAFHTEADAYTARRAAIPASSVAKVNASLLAIEKLINGNFTCLDVWEATIYPHEQVLLDVQSLGAALVELGKRTPNAASALKDLGNVSQTWYGPFFSPEIYAWELTRHQPDSPRLFFGSLGHIPRLWNVMTEYRQIEAGDFDAAAAGLLPMHGAALTDLDQRLAGMCNVLETVTPMIEALK
jgi:Peptidase family M28